jgi:23S rRNA (adenine2503-C2)-methyltransferase
MGMGEPLLNFNNLVGALAVLGDEQGLGYGGRRITVSTAGIPKQIRELAAAPVSARLALSLNAADDPMRRALMPARANDKIANLLAACDEYAERTGRRVSLEYVLIAGVNDRPEDAENLRRLTRTRPFKLNLIPFNPGERGSAITWPGSRRSVELKRPSDNEIESFVRRLLPGVPAVTVRRSQGVDVGGGCGQLRGMLL